jgi:hypothetical protein
MREDRPIDEVRRWPVADDPASKIRLAFGSGTGELSRNYCLFTAGPRLSAEPCVEFRG